MKTVVLETHSFTIEGLDFQLKGKIIKSTAHEVSHRPYEWIVSHYCKSFDTAMLVHKPSVTNEESLEEARTKLKSYANMFRAIDVEENPNF